MNIFAVLVATILEFFLGYLWYSKLIFGKQFLKYLGKSEDELEMTTKDIIGPLIASFLIFLFYAILLDLIGTYDLIISLLVAVIVWAGFILTSNIYSVFYEGRSIGLYIIFIGYHLVGILIGALIIGLWQ
jgi:hypothetical protein